MVEVSYNVYMSKCCVSFEKVYFIRNVAQSSGEDKTRICFAKTCRMLFYHNKFLFMDVKRSTSHFCFGDKFLGVDWQPKHITIGLFKASETT
jgi:hypothetical protein